MKDTIYREDAINAVHKNYDSILDFKSDGCTVASSFEDIINALPPAQPERMRGRWIIDRGLYKCSCCKQLWVEWWAVSKPIERMNKEMPYCPMCGADMRGDRNE